MKILLVEDDDLIARDLEQVLASSGYIVDCAANGEEAWFKGDVENYDAVVLDLGLPSMDGLSILKRWRENGRQFPILVLTARGTWAERVAGIDAGADDYLPKPFEIPELLARLRAIVRRSAGQASPIIRVGPVILDTRLMTVEVNGRDASLSAQEYRLLSYLMHHKGRTVSASELVDHLYADDTLRAENAVEVLIGRLRRKLDANIIQTKRGFGYVVTEGKT